MARSRNIKPGFFQHDTLCELTPLERLAFIGMWTVADFKGCIEFRPKRLKVQLLPYDECDFEAIAINLERSGFVAIYSVQGQRYIKIVNFEKHQNPHKNEREAGSEIPDIDQAGKIVNEIKELKEDGTKPDFIGSARADSLSLIPSSLIPDSPILIAAKPERASLARPTKKCPESFVLTDELRTWAAAECPLVNADFETAKLRDHTFQTARVDWPGAWRNWLRKAQKDAEAMALKRTFADARTAETPYQRSQRELVEKATGGLLNRRPPPANQSNHREVFDAQAAAIALG